MARFYVSIAGANCILDLIQECLTLEHAKKLAAQTAEELVRNKEPSRLQRKARSGHGNLVYNVPLSRKLNGVRLDRA